ncbi:MAG: hypothetical protein U0R51_04085 [Solirubrobacterales bacterium]
MEAAIAGRSRYRVVPHSVLAGAGFTEKQIRGRVEEGRLVALHPGVYAVGPEPLDDAGRFRAAVLAGGGGALLAGRAACAWWGVVVAAPETADVLAPAHRRNRPGVRFRRAAIRPDEATVHRGIPVVCPARAILDLAREVNGRELERALNEARVLRLPDRPSFGELIDRYPGRRGIAAARDALAMFEAGPTPTRSPGEERVLAVIDANGLPRPLTNHRVETAGGTFLVDFAWPDLRVALELDAWSTHSSRRTMSMDRRRDRALRIAGWHPSRVFVDDLADGPALATEIRSLLAAAQAAAPGRVTGHRAA